MELRVLKYFAAVAETENITRAAQKLHLSQPTLSRQLAALEEELGCQLFIRQKHRLKLTSQGYLLLRRARELLELAELTENELHAQKAEVEGTIRVCSGDLAAFHDLCEVMADFMQLYPKVNFSLFSGSAIECIEKMERGLMDLGVFLEPAGLEDFSFLRFLKKETFHVFMRPDHPLAGKAYITREDLLDWPLNIPARAGIRDLVANWFGREYDKIHPRCSGNLPDLICMLSAKSDLVSFSMSGTRDFLDDGKLAVRPLYPEISTTSILVWKRQARHSRAVEVFLETLMKRKDLFVSSTCDSTSDTEPENT